MVKLNTELVSGRKTLQAVGPVRREGFEIFIILEFDELLNKYVEVATANSEFLALKILSMRIHKAMREVEK